MNMTTNEASSKRGSQASCSSKGSAHPSRRWWRHRVVLEQLRGRLLSDREEQATEAFEQLEGHPAAPAETATDEFAHDLSFALLANEEQMLHEVDAALSRIAAGTYGICEESGRRIPAARLKAIPWTRYTKDVAEQVERQGLLSQPHISPLVSTKGRTPSGLALVEEHDELALREEPEIATHKRREDREKEELSTEDPLTFEEHVTSRSD